MSEINSFSDYASKYNTNMDYSSLFGGGAPYIDNGMGGINVSDYAMIKNGSYGKLMKAYYLDSRINMTRLVPQLRVLHKSQPA